MKTKRGFTMVEMLTVIVIIAILAAITMKLMVYVNEKTGKARATSDIERIKHAIIEYHAVYGIVPPVSGVAREYEGKFPSATPDAGMGFYDGLATYLYADAQKAKWLHFVESIAYNGDAKHNGANANYGVLVWTNNYQSIRDPWDRDYVYTTLDPYQSFILYSKGPDGVANTADDIGTKWNE